MNRLKNFYIRNIYGVIGTLVFHILVFTLLLLSEIGTKIDVESQGVLIELLNMLIEEPEILREEQAETPSRGSDNRELMSNIASNRLAEQSSRTSNVASNTNNFFNQDYLDELEAARQLVANVSNQLAQNNNVSEISMPVISTEGMNPDSIKNIIYTGDSTIEYYLDNRYHTSLPNPTYLAYDGGKVIVDISVNRNGKVVRAVPRKSSSVQSEQLYILAESAALQTVFNPSPTAPAVQTGTIHYTFIAQ